MERHHLGVTRNALRENRLVIFGLCSIGLRRHGPFISCHIFLPLCFALSGTHLGSSFDGLDINCAKTWRRTVQVTSDKATVLMVDNYHFELVGCPGKVMIFPISFSGVVLAQFFVCV